MSVQDWIIIAAVAAAIVAAAVYMVKRRRSGKCIGCSGEGCGHCPYADRKRKRRK